MKTIEWIDISPMGSYGHFCCEASSLGLAPGQWPHFLKTGLGNGQDFVRQYREAEIGFVYQQAGGTIRLLVLND